MSSRSSARFCTPSTACWTTARRPSSISAAFRSGRAKSRIWSFKLGTGEISAELDALGASRIRETIYPGVWWLEHYNTAGELAGRYIEITTVPEILKSQEADVAAGRARLHERVSNSDEADAQ